MQLAGTNMTGVFGAPVVAEGCLHTHISLKAPSHARLTSTLDPLPLSLALSRSFCALACCRDINPVAPTHILIIPKRRDGLTQLRNATADHAGILGHMLEVAATIATEQKLEGFRCVFQSLENAEV